jgi:hypothetical protein
MLGEEYKLFNSHCGTTIYFVLSGAGVAGTEFYFDLDAYRLTTNL